MHFKEIIAFLFDQFSILTATERSAGNERSCFTCSDNLLQKLLIAFESNRKGQAPQYRHSSTCFKADLNCVQVL